MSGGDFIVQERHLRDRERWLRNHAAEVAPYLVDGRECIVFTFSRQESADRATTRVGGLPHWPRERPWPTCRTCRQPSFFAGQLDFRHPSVREGLPGDVLTFHQCLQCWPWAPNDPGDALLAWHSALPPSELIEAAQIPPMPEEARIGAFFGTPHRVIDYPTPEAAYGGGIAGEDYTHLYFTLQGTKIGGHPPRIQDFELPRDRRYRPMRFLGAFGSVDSPDGLLWGDMGSVLLWISEGAEPPETTWFIECY